MQDNLLAGKRRSERPVSEMCVRSAEPVKPTLRLSCTALVAVAYDFRVFRSC